MPMLDGAYVPGLVVHQGRGQPNLQVPVEWPAEFLS